MEHIAVFPDDLADHIGRRRGVRFHVPVKGLMVGADHELCRDLGPVVAGLQVRDIALRLVRCAGPLLKLRLLASVSGTSWG
jgi:hypothetical protein